MTKVDLRSNFELIVDYDIFATFRERESKITFDAFYNSKNIITGIKYTQWYRNGKSVVNCIETKINPESIDEIKTFIQNSLGKFKKLQK